jgi:ATP-dependent Clp protease ATP-binding subunit ClpA
MKGRPAVDHPRYSLAAMNVIKRAKEEAQRLAGEPVGGGHLLLGLLGTPDDAAARLLRESVADPARVTERLGQLLASQPATPPEARRSWSAEGRRVLDLASEEARAHPVGGQVLALHLLLALLRQEDGSGVRILRALGADPDEVRSRAITQLQENAA